ncbi:MAG TPA: tetratricopeptide repeat protein [Bacteroidetes bacterium]|nr:tetratricopeptide repeat protein [Bacteroidota bacterium]
MKFLSGLLFIIIAGFFSVVKAQEKIDPETLYNDGNYFFFREDYQEALFDYLKLIGTKYENANLYYKIGYCYIHTLGEETKAIPYLEKAIKDINPKYKKRSPKETKAPEHALFYLGNAYRMNNELDKALETYQKFKSLPDFDDKYNRNIVDNEIKACEKAKIIQDIPVQIEEHNLGQPINTGTNNYYPVLSRDESTIFFMTELKFYNAIFMSRREGGKWTVPINITPQVESDGDAYPSDISADKKTLYLIKGRGNDRDIYISKWKDGMWTKMIRLSDQINSGRAEAHASLSPDNKTLFFSSNRRGGYGKLDIYLSRLSSSGEWGPPENMGKTINTPFNEDAPYLSDDKKRIYFVSEGHYNMGGYDIFYSEKKNNGWNTPANIGFPINTTRDNNYFFPVRNGLAGYLSRITPEGYGKKDIYRIEILPSKKNQFSIFEGKIDMHGLNVDWDKGFEILIKDKGTGDIAIRVIYDPRTKTFRYYSYSGNYLYEYKPDDDSK